MKKFAALVATALLLAQGAAAAQDAALDGRLKKVRDKQTIAVAYRTDAQPFAFEDAGKQPTGYSVDLCRRVVGAIQKQLGLADLKVEWVPVTGATRFDAVAGGRADMECGSSSVTLGRMKNVDFSSFIFADGTGLLVKTALPAKGLGDLAGKKIGVITGTTNDGALKTALVARKVIATVVPVATREEGLAKVESGEIDAFASDRVLLMGLSGKAKDAQAITLLTEPLSFEPYAITLPRGDWQLRLAVNGALAQIYRSGAIAEIYGRWFGSPARAGVVTEMVYVFGALAD
jgi:ABC-type amino acid transport substrate-binding protein